MNKFFGDSSHAHALGGVIEPLPVVGWPKQEYLTFLVFVGFHAFKNRLSVVQRRRDGAQRQIAVGYDAGVLPLAVAVLGNKHVVGDVPAENEVVEVNLLQARLRRRLNVNL